MKDRLIDDINEELISEIKKKYGSPVLIFDEVSFINNFNRLQDSFRNIYPKYHIAYSYKTNYTPYIGRLVKKLGGYAEVVSDFELYAALKNGNDYNSIIYNGPLKQDALDEYVINGGIVNIDNMQECERIISIANKNLNITFKVGVRINIDVGQSFISRFGLDSETTEFENVISLLRIQPNIDFCGLHCHIGQSRTINNWKQRVEKMLAIADVLFLEKTPMYIDLGSGMFGDMEPQFKKQFEETPSYEEYAKVVAGEFEKHYKNYEDDEKPLLFTEPGATVASRYMWLLTTITSHKCVRERIITGVDSSFFNAGETSRYATLPIRIISKNPKFELGDIVGYTCLEDDCLYSECKQMGDIGDMVLLGNTGGYSLVFKPPFILPDIPVVVLKSDDTVELIKHKQTFDNMLELYI